MKIFYLPDLGEGLAEAEIREWYVKVGDTVTVDQPLVSMETAKAIVDVPSPYAGKILRLHGSANDIIKTGAPFIEYEIAGASAEKPADKGSVVGKLESSEKKWDDGDVIIGSATSTNVTIKAMPAARALAKELNIDLATVKATGPGGLITANDVKNSTSTSSQPQHTTTEAHEVENIHGVRRVMAQTMMLSQREVVPVTIIEDADITNLPLDEDLTVALLMAMTKAAQAEPALNAWFDAKTFERKIFTNVHIGMAVDSVEGLFVPVIKNIEQYDKKSLRAKIDELKLGVKKRELNAKEMQGATVSLSNFGMIAGRYATPVIVPPAVAILGCGRVRSAPVVADGKVVVGRILPLSFTFDHRAVTGGEATRYLKVVVDYLEGK